MRISETKVAQLIESDPPFVVLQDDTDRREVQIAATEVQQIVASLHAPFDSETVLVKGMPLTPEEAPVLCFALGYFWTVLGPYSRATMSDTPTRRSTDG